MTSLLDFIESFLETPGNPSEMKWVEWLDLGSRHGKSFNPSSDMFCC